MNEILNGKDSLNILIIEDNPADVYLIKDYLKSSEIKFSITHCERLSEAIEQLCKPIYDVVLLDLGLPDSWGLNTLRKIQNFKISAAVIVLTGLDDEQTASRALNEGAQDYIVKNKINTDYILHAIKYGIERKKHQLELEKLNAELEQKVIERTKVLKELIVTKDKFFGIIAHDLKNPFTGLLGASEILSKNADSFDSKGIQEMSSILHSSAKNIYAMLENLLEWARTQTGNINYNPENINITQIISENFKYIKIFADNKNIKLSSEVLQGLNVTADKNMINTILRNLLNNAVKFTKKGGNVIISAMKIENNIIFSVKDSGIGIPQKDIDKLFRIDIKYSNRGTNDETGTGLGLILCKEFVEKHNGQIWVESTQDKGTEFKFTIPVSN
jgi:two-component system, sensor histidine kinase and response regulator